ncbi:MAG: heavy metal translocating P-type ATPase [Prevotella sp.]|nr:heavy metal translocating P-type ATPase [Prevotella sp.]
MEKRDIAIIGMACAGCAANVERRLKSMEGVEHADVNFTTRCASVTYDPQITNPQMMRDELQKIGFDMAVDDEQNITKIERRKSSLLRKRVITSWCLALLVMALSMKWVKIGDEGFTNQVMLIMALANILWCGRQFYVTAWKQATHGMANMDTLVALSTFISFALSFYNTFWGEQTWSRHGISNHTYFDASVMIITFVLTGRMLEEKAKHSTARAIRALIGLAPKTALIVTKDAEKGSYTTTEVPIATLQRGDIIEVRQGNKIPVDGIVMDNIEVSVSNTSSPTPTPAPFVDESMISGEPAPVAKNANDKVYAGTIVKQGKLLFRASEVGSKTMLAQIIKMVQEAQGSKAPVQRTVDKIAMFFVPSILIIAVITFIVWMVAGGAEALPRAVLSAVSVLVIACPCAMGLATPTALMVGIGKAAQKNILIKDATALERIKNIKAVVIDKTGTLTIPNKDIDFTTTSNKTLEERETLKPHAKEAIEMLHSRDIVTYMMSGDNEDAVAYWARKAGIRHWQSKVMPQDKENIVRTLQSEGLCVAMVGDGINDAQALAAADVSIAMGKGTDIAMDVAQVTLMGTDLRRIYEAIRLSQQTVNTIRQNLFWAFIYNIICIPLAAGVTHLWGMEWQITPMWASALMAFSSISVVLNSLRLYYK